MLMTPMLMTLALATLLPTARATDADPSTPVLYADDPNAAVYRVAADSGQPVWELEPVRITEKLTGGLPRAVGRKQPAACTAVPSTNSTVRDAVMRAEGQVSYQKWPQATAELATAASALACLSEPAEASLASRLMFLQGITLVASGKADEATAMFRRATFFQPRLVWDESFAPEFRPAFDTAVAAVPKDPTGKLILGPGVAGATTLWVDGRMATITGDALDLPAGEHLIQILQPGVSTLTVSLVHGYPVALLVPLQTPDSLVAKAGDPAHQALFDAIVDQSFSDNETAYVWQGARTWRVSGVTGPAHTWEQLPVATSVTDAGKKRVGGALRVAGVVAAGIGAVSVGTGLGLWAPNHVAEGGETDQQWATRTQAASAGSAMFTSGLITLGLGVVAVGVSFPLGG